MKKTINKPQLLPMEAVNQMSVIFQRQEIRILELEYEVSMLKHKYEGKPKDMSVYDENRTPKHLVLNLSK